jgi:hypothetical protein
MSTSYVPAHRIFCSILFYFSWSWGSRLLARGCRRFYFEPVGEPQPVQANAAADLLKRMGGGWKAG